MTATEVIAEIDRLPPDEQRAVFVYVRMLVEESGPDSFPQSLVEVEHGENDGGALMAEQWIAVRRSLRPRLSGAIEDFIAARLQDRS